MMILRIQPPTMRFRRLYRKHLAHGYFFLFPIRAAGKSYRFAFEVLCAKPATFTPSVRIGRKDISGKVTSLDRWLPCHVDFTLPNGTNQAQLRLWCGSLAPGKYFKLRNLSLKELEK